MDIYHVDVLLNRLTPELKECKQPESLSHLNTIDNHQDNQTTVRVTISKLGLKDTNGDVIKTIPAGEPLPEAIRQAATAKVEEFIEAVFTAPKSHVKIQTERSPNPSLLR